MKKRAYVVNYERGADSWWVATVQGVPGCLTQGKSIEQTKSRIRDALSLFVADANTADLIDNVKLPKTAQTKVATFKSNKKRLEAEEIVYQQSARGAAEFLMKGFGLSSRDVAAVMGMSHQRVHQMVSGVGKVKVELREKTTGKRKPLTPKKGSAKTKTTKAKPGRKMVAG